MDRRLTEAIQGLASRLDLIQGRDSGHLAGSQRAMSVRGQLTALAGVLIAAIGLAVTVLIATR